MLKFINIFKRPKMTTKIKALYKNSFPKDERAPFFFLKAKAKKNLADFYGVYDDTLFVGLVYEVYYNDIVYVFYLAINPHLRGKGYGSGVLNKIKQRNKGKRIILNIEILDKNSDNYDERVKRKEFYLKNGFKETQLKTKEGNVVYEMLCYGGKLNHSEYAELIKNYMGVFLYKLFFKVPY